MQVDQDKHGGQEAQVNYKYWVFISYSHADEDWANWLHKALERYRIPRGLVGRQISIGVIPKRLFPVFRDQDELPGAPSLPQKIDQALEQSRSLLVICSPRSAVSQWVDKEIDSYKRLGRKDRLFCLLVDGEPNASDHPERGLLEAFPQSLRFEAGPDGQLARETAEPIAVDVRKGKDTKSRALIRLVAGILGVDFDELWHRDRRRRFWQGLQLALIALLVLAGGAGIWWDRQKALQEQSRITEREQAVVRANALASTAESVRLQRGDMLELSVLLAAEAMKRSLALDHLSPEINQILRDGLALLPRKASPPLPHGPSYGTQVNFSPSGQWITTFKGPKAWVWDTAAGKAVAELPHASDVRLATFSPDGGLLATASADGTVQLWDTGKWTSVARLKHGRAVTQATFAPTGQRLATIAGPEIRIWDAATGEGTAQMEHGKEVVALAFVAGGEQVWSAGDDGTARLWDAASGRERSRFEHGGRWPSKMSFSPGAHLLAVALNDTTVWEVPTGKQVARMSNPDQAYDVAFSPDGRYVATGAGFNTHVWEVSTGREIANLRHENTVWDVEFSHNGRWLATASPDRTARLWDVATGREIARMVHADEVWKVALSAKDAQMATVSAPSNAPESTVYLWRTPDSATTFELRHGDGVFQVAGTADGKRLLTISADFAVHAWDPTTSEGLFQVKYGGSQGAAGLSPDGRLIAAGVGRFGPMRIIDAATQKVLARVAEGGDWVTVMGFSPDGTTLVTTSRFAPLDLWQTATGRHIATIAKDTSTRMIGFSRDGARLVTVSGVPLSPTMTAQVWETSSGNPRMKVELPGRLGQAALDPSGQRLFLVHEEGQPGADVWRVRSWALPSEQQIFEIPMEGPVSVLSVSPDGRWLAIGDEAGNVRLSSTSSGAELGRIRLESEVAKIVFTEDSAWLAVAAGSTASVWEVASRREVARMPRGGKILDLTFASGGHWLITGSDDHVAKVWLWQPTDLTAQACRQLSSNMTRKEWRKYLGSEPYSRTCPELPAPKL